MVTRPLLRYFGGKFLLAPWIIENMPKHNIYVEPFGGGGSVLLLKTRSYAEVYNDLDSEIVNVFECFRDNFEALANKLINTPFSRQEYDLAYLSTDDKLESVRRTIVRCFMGFGNSAQRADGKTGFQAMTELTGSSKANQWATWLGCIEAFRERLHGVVIENRDALEVIDQQDTAQTLFFCDPPYVHDSRKSGSYKYEMSNKDHEILCEKLSHVDGMVMLCGYENEIYDKLGWLKLKRKATSMASVNRERTECLWLNKKAEENSSQIKLF